MSREQCTLASKKAILQSSTASPPFRLLLSRQRPKMAISALWTHPSNQRRVVFSVSMHVPILPIPSSQPLPGQIQNNFGLLTEFLLIVSQVSKKQFNAWSLEDNTCDSKKLSKSKRCCRDSKTCVWYCVVGVSITGGECPESLSSLSRRRTLHDQVNHLSPCLKHATNTVFRQKPF